MARFWVILFDGFDELDGIAPFEVLAAAARQGAAIEVELRVLGSARGVSGSYGLPLGPFTAIDESHADWIIVPGGNWVRPDAPGTRREVARGELPRLLRDRHDRGTKIASVCTGAMLIAEAGLLEGKQATTHPVARDDLHARGITFVPEVRVVDAGDVVTAGGVTSGLDLGLWLLEREAGSAMRERIETHLVHPMGKVLKS